jgi:DNA topoisomerase-1
MTEVEELIKCLVIVESPAKAKTIKRFLGRGYRIEASMGHVRDLPKSQMGVDKEKGFEPKYITIRGKGPVLEKIRKTAREAEKILLATDPDREGEAISWHLAYILDIDARSSCRIEFNEVTKNAVKKAVKNPRPIDVKLVEAQQARRIVDRLVGYEISPLLWKKVKKGLSAGRVQSVALKLICDREEEIDKFVSEEYWKLYAILYRDKKKDSFKVELHSRRGRKINVKSEEEMKEILVDLRGKEFRVSEIRRGKKTRSPNPPYTTSSLQQDAHNRLGFTVKRTMTAAQQLYEGIDIKGDGSEGLITYMRTDSVRVSDTALAQVRNYIKEEWGGGFLPKMSRVYKGKKGAQNAHEAIRPTSVSRSPESLKDSLTPDQYKIYSLIWKRFVASQMSNAQYQTVSIDVDCDGYLFKASGSTVTFKGFLEVFDDVEKQDSRIPPLNKGDLLKVNKLEDKQYFTQPPARYTEASLIKTLEEDGIGRPSTYAPVISTILQRGYVERDKKSLLPTYLGRIVNEVMVEYFREIVDVEFTAEMEEKLDEIEENGLEWRKVVEEFYRPLETMVKKAEVEMEKIVIQDKETDEICELCGRNMVIKHGRFGKFLACPGFPECRNTKPYLEKVGVKCPKCTEGDIVLKRTKKGRIFYGCSRYPDCDFMTWNKPAEGKCSICGNRLWEKKGGKKQPPVCLNEECENYGGK